MAYNFVWTSISQIVGLKPEIAVRVMFRLPPQVPFDWPLVHKISEFRAETARYSRLVGIPTFDLAASN